MAVPIIRETRDCIYAARQRMIACNIIMPCEDVGGVTHSNIAQKSSVVELVLFLLL